MSLGWAAECQIFTHNLSIGLEMDKILSLVPTSVRTFLLEPLNYEGACGTVIATAISQHGATSLLCSGIPDSPYYL